jgi:diguanylate cyclase (GGDEF)-like protein
MVLSNKNSHVSDTKDYPLNLIQSCIQKILDFSQRQIALNYQLNHKLIKSHQIVGALNDKLQAFQILLDQISVFHQCTTQQNILDALNQYVSQLFPHSSGYIRVFKPSAQNQQHFYEWGVATNLTSHTFDEYPLNIHQQAFGTVYFQKNYFGSQPGFRQELLAKWLEHLAIALWTIHHIDTLELQTITDPLTGLFNRRYMMDILKRLTISSNDSNSVGIMMIDLDFFKKINDTYGHQAGDSVLKDFSLYLKGIVRPTDIVCRYGGEEFALILPRTPLKAVCERAERICNGLRYITMRHDHQTIGQITVSIGVAMFPEHGLTAAGMIEAADQALYMAKSKGRNQVVHAADEVQTQPV